MLGARDPYAAYRRLAFHFDPEKIHQATLRLGQTFPALGKMLGRRPEGGDFSVAVGATRWAFPVGLAAGLDKNAQCYPFWQALGLGAVEVGTVTPRPQKGNPRPRLWRLPEQRSLLNSLGFNNRGAHALEQRVRSLKRSIPLGINVGKNKDTPPDQALADYLGLIERFGPLGDYLVINVSSPNTPGLRKLQDTAFLGELFDEIDKTCQAPVYLKLAPDISDEQLAALVDFCQRRADGIVATNTTNDHSFGQGGQGGLSGQLLKKKARQVREKILQQVEDKERLAVIGVGGFENFSDCAHFWRAGGKAIQVYTALIYQGPQLLHNIQLGLKNSYQRYGVSHFEEFLAALKKDRPLDSQII